jgi:hypothetical protein
LWHRRRKIIAAGLGKLEELSSHDSADGMTADVFSTRIAAAVSNASIFSVLSLSGTADATSSGSSTTYSPFST